VKLPVVKILWGMFAFPSMYPAAFFRAVAWPMLGLVAVTLVWVSGAITSDDRILYWSTVLANYAVFAWLAVRTHRLVLIEPDEQQPSDVVLPLSFRYLSALTTGAAMKFLMLLAMMTLLLLFVNLLKLQSIGVSSMPAPSPPPPPDPGIQRLINYGGLIMQAPALYLLARWSTMLPAIALGHEWSPRTAWQQTRGNGWRLALVVFLIPWLLDAAVDWAYDYSGSAMLVGLIAIARAAFLALGVIALSLSYRELPPWPAPPPTAPRA
jgi:hypothetical protein